MKAGDGKYRKAININHHHLQQWLADYSAEIFPASQVCYAHLVFWRPGTVYQSFFWQFCYLAVYVNGLFV